MNEHTPHLDGVTYAIPLKVTKAGRYFKRGFFCICFLILNPSRLLAKGKLMSLAKAFCLSKGNITFNGV
jgi:hypothetical protein